MRRAAWVSAADARVKQVKHRFEAAQRFVEQTVLWRVWERLLENEFVDRSVALGAKAFVSLFPALIVVAAFTPASVRASILQTLTRRAGLSGDGLATVKGAFATTDDVRKATGVVGLIFTFFYVNSFTGALRRVYTKAWRRPAGGRASGYAGGAAWLAGIVGYFALLGALRSVLTGGPETGLFALMAWMGGVGVWWMTAWLMLGRQVRLRALVSGAVLTGTGMTAYAVTASLWMPRTVSENQHQFGFFGVALAMVTWLTGAAMIIVAGACAAPVLVEDPGWIGRAARGPEGSTVLADGAPPSQAAPLARPTFSDALGHRRSEEPRVVELPDYDKDSAT
jgi:membrane protein